MMWVIVHRGRAPMLRYLPPTEAIQSSPYLPSLHTKPIPWGRKFSARQILNS